MTDGRRSAPAALRNREPIAEVLQDWLPAQGTVLEIASGTGEHAVYFARRFPHLDWQPSDGDPASLASIASWAEHAGLANLKVPIVLDAGGEWPPMEAAAIFCSNMAHISPWSATTGLIASAAKVLAEGAPLIFYGPWFAQDIVTAQSNLDFNAQLQSRDPAWGIRSVEALQGAALDFGFSLVERRAMPANNFMLLLKKADRR
jgi:hypothetical protein